MTRKLLAAGVIGLLLCLATAEVRAAEAVKAAFKRQDAVRLIAESRVLLKRGQDILRFASVKLPDLVEDNRKFRKLDQELERAREETYPGLNAADRLKEEPANLREVVRLYMALRLFQGQLLRVSDYLSALPAQAAGPLAAQIADHGNKIGRLAIKASPYLYKVVDAYQASAPVDRVDLSLNWEEKEVQGPEI